jgi:hypothetical protein
MDPKEIDAQDPDEHDPEESMHDGMSSPGEEVDEAETMASTGNAESAFVEIVTGSATGLGIDRGESVGTGGLAGLEDLDEVAEGDYWRQNFERRPFESPGRPVERFEPGERLGWMSGADMDPRDRGTRERGGTTPPESLPHPNPEGAERQEKAQLKVDDELPPDRSAKRTPKGVGRSKGSGRARKS